MTKTTLKSGRHDSPCGPGPDIELTDADRLLLLDALSSLLRERHRVLELSRTLLGERARAMMENEDFGIREILRVARLLESGSRQLSSTRF